LIYEFDRFRFDAHSRRLMTAAGQTIDLPENVLDVLAYLIEHAGRPIDEAELLQAVRTHASGGVQIVDQAIAGLRTALEDDAARPRCIATQSGGAYRFICEVSVLDATSQAEPTSPNDAPVTGTWLAFGIAAFLALALIAVWAAQRSPFG